jgi:RHS repeat-associated protein
LTNEQRSGPNLYNITYAYDGVGNRTLLVNSGAPTTSTYNSANELATSQASAGVTTYTFDGDGNLLTTLAPGIQLTTNTWDGENRLTKVALPTAIVDSFTCNGDGQRVQKQDSTGTTNLLWEGQNVLLEASTGNVVQAVYTLEPAVYGNLISQTRGGTNSFYLYDALGSTRQLASNTGLITDRYLYDSFGNGLMDVGATVSNYRFIGRFGFYLDPDTGNYSVRARYYTAAVARFLSRDPLAERAVTSSNLYKYAYNNPVNIIDASGLKPSNICSCYCWLSAGFVYNYLKNYYSVDRHNDWWGNALSHCVIACALVQKCGFSCASDYWDGREGVPPNVFSDMDLQNNGQGYGCGLAGQDCFDCCVNKLQKGKLSCIEDGVVVKCPPPPKCWIEHECILAGPPQTS